MRPDFDAIIVGAGPAGSSAAILLSRAGWSVALVEKQTFPRRKVCGECIAASNLPLLDALGVGDRFGAVAGPHLRRLAVMQGENTVVADLPAFDHAKHPWGRALGRDTLDRLLIEEARSSGAKILQPCAIRSIEAVARGHRCRGHFLESRQGVLLHAPVVIAAQGSWKSLRSSGAEPRRKLRAGDLLAFKANFTGAELEEGLLPVLSFSGGYGGMVIADEGVLTIACCIRADRLDRIRHAGSGLPAGEAIEGLLQRECAGVAAALRHAKRQGRWLAAGPLHPGVHLNSNEGIFRIGNAAGEAHPIIGEGMSMAMQSAWLLCERLIRGGNLAGFSRPSRQFELRRRYAADWRRSFTRRLRLAAVFAHVAMRPRALPAFPLIRHFSPFLKYAAQLSGKVSSAVDC